MFATLKILDADFVVQTAQDYLSLTDLAELETSNCSTRCEIWKGSTWGRCAARQLSSKFTFCEAHLSPGAWVGIKELKS